jgi:hypothetical protein
MWLQVDPVAQRPSLSFATLFNVVGADLWITHSVLRGDGVRSRGIDAKGNRRLYVRGAYTPAVLGNSASFQC